MKPVILVLDDEEMVTTTIKSHLALQEGFDVVVFNRPAEALDHLKAHPVDVIVSDQVMPEMSGLEFFSRVKQIQPEAIRVLLTGYAHKDDAIRAINQVGLFQFLEKPWSNEELLLVIRNGLERKSLYSSLQRKIGELKVAGDEIERLKNGLVTLYLEKSVQGADEDKAQARSELRSIVGSEIESRGRRLLYAFVVVCVLLAASVSYIGYRSFFAIRQETAGLKLQIGDIQGKQLNPAEIERLRVALTSFTRPEAAAGIIAQYDGSVCLIQGTYVFRDPASGKLLRLRGVGPDGEPRVDPSGSVELTLEGDGPPLENFHTGTGFLARSDGKILTNRHVAQPWWADPQAQKFVQAGFLPQYRHFVAYFPRRHRPYALKALRVHPAADLAVLEVASTANLPPPIPLQETGQPRAGESVLLIGYPLGLEALVAKASAKELDQIPNLANLTQEQVAEKLAERSLIQPFITQGHISNVTDEMLIYDAVTTLGGSGGPLFNLEGKVIAINFAVLTQFTGASMGIPIRHALELMKLAF